jgi:hypothetical protein
MFINGKELQITICSFDEGMELQDAVADALASQKIDLGGVDVTKKKKGDENIDIGGIIQPILKVISSPRLRNALFACARRAIYDNQKIDKEFFEEAKNRALYYPIMLEVLKVNLGPFIGSLIGQFGDLKSLMGIKTQ